MMGPRGRQKKKKRKKERKREPDEEPVKESKNRDISPPKKITPWNMKVTVIPIVIGVLGTIHKRLAKRLEDW